MKLLLLLAGACVIMDQLSKAIALAWLSPGDPVSVVPGFNLTLGFNEGASFGMLSGVMSGRPLLMAALTGALTLVFAIMALRTKSPLESARLAMIVGGATGNLIDRLRQGAVTDFLDLYWQDWHWPAFNGADIAITAGALCILYAAIPTRRQKETKVD
jgi:signal peptidase II